MAYNYNNRTRNRLDFDQDYIPTYNFEFPRPPNRRRMNEVQPNQPINASSNPQENNGPGLFNFVWQWVNKAMGTSNQPPTIQPTISPTIQQLTEQQLRNEQLEQRIRMYLLFFLYICMCSICTYLFQLYLFVHICIKF